MSRKIREEDLLRYLTGEMDPVEARKLSGRLEADPEAAARLAALRDVWESLELPPTGNPKPGSSREIVRRVRVESAGGSWSEAPIWARAAAGLALPLGLALGLGLSPVGEAGARSPGESELHSVISESADAGLASSYYDLLTEEEPGPEGAS